MGRSSKEYYRKYREKNRERIRENHRRWVKEHPERTAAWSKAYRETHREQVNERHRLYERQRYATDPDARARRQETNRSWRAQNREHIRSQARERYRLALEEDPDRFKNRKRTPYDPLRSRGYTLKRKYGITAAEYDAMLASQAGRCAICASNDPKTKSGYFHVDHDHETGQVRALLCKPCNHVLGFASDNPETLMAAAVYLSKFSAPIAKLMVVK